MCGRVIFISSDLSDELFPDNELKSKISELLELCKKSAEFDGWVRKTGMKGYCKELKKETDEVINALESNDIDNLKEELGDVFMDLFEICILAEEESVFSFIDVLESAVMKIKRRRPYILENKKVSDKESVDYWYKAKDLEKLKKRKK